MFTAYQLISDRRSFEDNLDGLMWDGLRSFTTEVKSLETGEELTLTVHHHTEYDDPTIWEDLWCSAQLLCCCMPNYLPEHMRKLHVLPEGKGKVSVRRRGYYVFFYTGESQWQLWERDGYFDKKYSEFCAQQGIEEVDEFDLDDED